MWDLPEPGIEPVSLALAGEFLTREAPEGYFKLRNFTVNFRFLASLKGTLGLCDQIKVELLSLT